MTPIVEYLEGNRLSDSQLKAQKAKDRAMRYLTKGNISYKVGVRGHCCVSDPYGKPQGAEDIHKPDYKGMLGV